MLEASGMNKKQKIAMTIARIAALILLLLVIAYVFVRIKRDPELATAENIVKLISQNKIIATLEFTVLYLLKGISMVFPSAVINIASGMVFDFPLSAFISGFGIFVEFMVMFLIGRFLGNDYIQTIKTKYPVVEKVDNFQTNNSFFVSFLIRIMGVISYDMASLYLGASGINWLGFIAGSMCGATLNIIVDGLFGKYIFNPFSWQLWAVVGIRLLVIILAIFIRKVIRNKCVTKG